MSTIVKGKSVRTDAKRSLIREMRPADSSREHVAGFMGFAGLMPGKDAGQGKMACRCKAIYWKKMFF